MTTNNEIITPSGHRYAATVIDMVYRVGDTIVRDIDDPEADGEPLFRLWLWRPRRTDARWQIVTDGEEGWWAVWQPKACPNPLFVDDVQELCASQKKLTYYDKAIIREAIEAYVDTLAE
jgi:hypothetical protein